MAEDKRYWSRHAQAVKPYVPGEQLNDRNYIKLNTNENPYGPSPKLREVLQTVDLDRLRLYPDPNSQELRESIGAYFGLTPDYVFVGNGSDEVLDFAYRAFFDTAVTDSRPILAPELTYSFYPVFAEGNRMNYETVALQEDFRIDWRSLVRDDAQGVILANPNAPTGLALGLDELRLLLRELELRGQFLILDEAYIDFGGETGALLLDEFANFIVIQTFSKSRALAGLRLGFAIGRPSLILALEAMRDMVNSYTVDRLTQVLGQAAMDDWAYFQAGVERIVAGRKRFRKAATALGVRVLPSDTNFVLMEVPGLTGEAVYGLLRKRGILVRYLANPRLEPYVRVTIGQEQEMDAVLAALQEIMMREGTLDDE